jgi:hypothetical protein
LDADGSGQIDKGDIVAEKNSRLGNASDLWQDVEQSGDASDFLDSDNKV